MTEGEAKHAAAMEMCPDYWFRFDGEGSLFDSLNLVGRFLLLPLLLLLLLLPLLNLPLVLLLLLLFTPSSHSSPCSSSPLFSRSADASLGL